MPGYICYYKWTQQGIKDIKGAPDRIKQAKAAAEKAGIRLVGVWITFGRYDMVSVVDAPDDYTTASMALWMGSLGNVTTETVRALSEDEFAQVVQRLP